MKTTTLIFFIIACPGLVHPLRAQETFEPSSNRLHLMALRTTEQVHVDGKLEEQSWLAAPSTGNFVQIEPAQGEISENITAVKVLYDERNVYVGVYCAEPRGKAGLRSPDLKRDFNWRAHDTFAICFDTFNDKRNSISIVTDPYGAQKDYLSFDATFFDDDWNGLWKVRTTRTDSSWVAEFEIPWKSLRYPRQRDSVRSIGVNFLRLRRYSNEISVWSPYPRSFSFNRMEYAGSLDSLIVPKPGANIQFNPYTLASYNTVKAQQGKQETSGLKTGGELKWAINANSILDLTANTDFAQADADVRVNNLSRFSVLFPERRQFFLENASLFGSGLVPDEERGSRMAILPFFSRQIGLHVGVPVPISGGARFVHRSENNNYGGMIMNQRASSVTSASNIIVGRYSQNLGEYNRIGALLTARSAAGTDSTDRSTFIIPAVDAFFRLNKTSTLSAMVTGSAETGSGEHGYGGYITYEYTTNTVQAWWSEALVTSDYDPVLGFVSRKDVVSTTPGFRLNLRGTWVPLQKIIRAFKPGLAAEFYHQPLSKILLERQLTITPVSIELQSGGFLKYDIVPVHQRLLTSFEPLGISLRAGAYGYVRHMVSAGSDESRKVSYKGYYEWGNYYNGALQSIDCSLQVAPLPNISVKGGVNYNRFDDLGESRVSRSVTLFTIESRLALNPRLQLTGLYQHNTDQDVDVYNLRLAWEYKPLSYLYLVLNKTPAFDEESGRSLHQTGIVKITYLKQF